MIRKKQILLMGSRANFGITADQSIYQYTYYYMSLQHES